MSNNHGNPAELDHTKVQPKTPKVQELIESSKSIILATVDTEGIPNSSYAPFVNLDGSFQILVSYMARHTKNLRDGKKVSFMFIDDESASRQIYARNRLTIDSEAVLVEKGGDLWNRALEALKTRHGKVVDVISEMDDFIMFDLKPIKGAYVNGFGSAYFVNADLEVQDHRTGNHGAHNVDTKQD